MLNRVVVQWTGAQIRGTAVSVLHFYSADGSAPALASLKTAYDNVAGILPAGVTLAYPSSGDQIDPTTGQLVNVWTATAPANTVGSGPANAAAGAGACVTWDTGAVLGGRRLRGRTFIVPLHNSCYDIDGTLYSTAYSNMNAFATAMKAVPGFAIWKRPSAKGASNGGYATVASAKVRDHVAFLKSRRD